MLKLSGHINLNRINKLKDLYVTTMLLEFILLSQFARSLRPFLIPYRIC
jgi:hypothetical protein